MAADFTACTPASTHNPTTGDSSIDARVRQLVAESGCEKTCDSVVEMIMTALKMGRDETTTADLKLFNRSLKELRYAANVFAPYRHVRKVVVFGSARTAPDAPEYLLAEEFSRRMREEHHYMTITGGGEGIMGGAQRGAGREHSFGLNIRLPFEQRANETIHGDAKLVNFNYFFTRKLNFLKETHAVALFPGGFGTMDEGFEVLTLMQTGKARILPVVLIDKPGGRYWETWLRFLREDLLQPGLVSPDDFHLFKMTHNLDEAIGEIAQFYRNFRSYRWVGQRLVLRIVDKLTPTAVALLNEEFVDILVGGEIVQTTALHEERNEKELADLPRLVLSPKRKNFGRFRQLINAVNAAETE
jgi:uncharacterized protein (TIGR00730 family)